MFPVLVLALAFQNPQIGQEWSPVFEIPVQSPVTKRVTLLKTQYNYWENRWYPPISPKIQAWYAKHGHLLLDWRWDLSKHTWVRKRGPQLCLT